MLVAGCDVGSLTAKAVILKDNSIISTSIMRVRSTAEKSSVEVLFQAIKQAGCSIEEMDMICNTGYGRFENPYSRMNRSEISCHGMGAFFVNRDIRTIIDIGAFL
jgi:activator of 2-hydroxyglutaryl-CoA dehydratase